jgi:hypothetical protein
MMRFGLLALAIAGVVALAPVGSEAQVMSQAPAQTEASQNCDECRRMSENCQNQKTPADQALCRRAALQCRCSK